MRFDWNYQNVYICVYGKGGNVIVKVLLKYPNALRGIRSYFGVISILSTLFWEEYYRIYF